MLRQMLVYRGMMTALCVLALLLLAGSFSPISSGAGPASISTATVAIAAARDGKLPCSGHDHVHGLACCGGASCMTGYATLTVIPSLDLPLPTAIYVALSLWSPTGIGRAPDFHPPRFLA